MKIKDIGRGVFVINNAKILVNKRRMKDIPSFLKADSVQMQNLPTWPPGASLRRFKASTEMVSTPGMLRKALVRP